MEFEVRTEGLTDFEIRFRAINESYREGIRRTVEYAAMEAGKYMVREAPLGKFEDGNHLPGSLKEAVVVTPSKFSPGGAGGGGSWSAHAGVDRDRAPHAEYVIHGTGIFGPRHTPIFARPGFARRRVGMLRGEKGGQRHKMRFMYRGDIYFKEATLGQEPQTRWFEGAQRLANNIVNRRLKDLGGGFGGAR